MTKIILCMLTCLLGSMAIASMPHKYIRCSSEMKVPSVQGSAGIFFSEDCGTAYVLPPINGKITFNKFLPAAGLDLACARSKSAMEESEFLETQIRKVLYGSNLGAVSTGNDPLFPNDVIEPRVLTDEEWAQYDKLSDRRRRIIEDLAPYSKMHGAYVNLDFNLDWARIVEKYQNLMPKVRVVAMPLDWSVLSFRAAKSAEGNLGTIAALDVAGIKKAPDGSAFEIQDDDSILFGGGATGAMTINALGACKIKSISQVKAAISINVTYGYSLGIRSRYTAKYNLGAFVKRIRESERKGGMFSSKTVTRLIEDRSSTDWFEFDGEFEDASFKTQDLEKEVKKQLLDRVIETARALGFGTQTPGLAMMAGGPHGAQVAADSLDKCPHVYCMIASGALRFTDAVFGSDSATDVFISNNNFWGGDSVTSDVAFKYIGTSGLK